MLSDCGHGVWPAAIHQPGHQVGAIAPEIEERTVATELGIVKPGKKLGRHVDFCGALMTVVNDDFAYIADRVLVDEIVSGVIAAIPSGLVVDEHGDFGGACGTLDGAAVFDTYGERFFHHHWDAVP